MNMSLSRRQEEMMVRMLGGWNWPRDGRKAHGWRQTLWSLKKKGMVQLLQETRERSAGWALTPEGLNLALQLRSEGVRP